MNLLDENCLPEILFVHVHYSRQKVAGEVVIFNQ